MRQPQVWGHGSVVLFLIIAGILLFGPFFMASTSPPGVPLMMVYPLVLAVVLIFLLVVTRLDADDEDTCADKETQILLDGHIHEDEE